MTHLGRLLAAAALVCVGTALQAQTVAGNEAVCRTPRKGLKTADNAGDDPTVDLLTQRLNIHEKNAWMLRSLLE